MCLSVLDAATYHKVSDETMEALSDYLENLLEDFGCDLPGSDIEYSVRSTFTYELGLFVSR